MDSLLEGGTQMDCYQTFRKLVITCRLHKRIVEREINQLGLHGSQHHLLMHLACHDGVTQKELASQLKVSPASVAVSLKKLESEGYISKEMDQKDNRFNKITITEKGKIMVEKSRQVVVKIDEAAFESFSEEEAQQLSALVERIYHSMEEIPDGFGQENAPK